MVNMPWQWGCHQRRRFLRRHFLNGPIQPPSAHYETAAPATPIVIDADPHRPCRFADPATWSRRMFGLRRAPRVAQSVS